MARATKQTLDEYGAGKSSVASELSRSDSSERENLLPGRARAKSAKDPIPPGSPPAVKLYSAREVCEHAGRSRQVLHPYTVMGLLAPAKRTPTNRLYFDESVFRRIELIRRMLRSGYTLQALRALFPWDA